MSEDPIAFHGIVWTEKLSRPEDGKLILDGHDEGDEKQQSATGEVDIEKKADLGDLVLKDDPKNELESTPQVEYPHGLKLAVIIASVCISVFIIALDQNIITTAMHSPAATPANP